MILITYQTVEAKNWSCLCYKERVHGVTKPVTACRETYRDCKKLSNAVFVGSSSLVRDSVTKRCRVIIGEMPWSRMGTISDWHPSQKKGSYWSTKGCMLNKKSLYQHRYNQKQSEINSLSNDSFNDVMLYFKLISSELVKLDYDRSTKKEIFKSIYFDVGKHTVNSSQSNTVEHKFELNRVSKFGTILRRGKSSTISFSRSTEYVNTVSNSVENSSTTEIEKMKSSSHNFGGEVEGSWTTGGVVGKLLGGPEARVQASYNYIRQNDETNRTSNTRTSQRGASLSRSSSYSQDHSRSEIHEVEANKEFSLGSSEEISVSSELTLKGSIPGSYKANAIVILQRNIEKKYMITVEITGKFIKKVENQIKKRQMDNLSLLKYLKNEIGLECVDLYPKNNKVYATMKYSEFFDTYTTKTVTNLIKALDEPKSISRRKVMPTKLSKVSAIEVLFERKNSSVFLNDAYIGRGPKRLLKKVLPNLKHTIKCVSSDNVVSKQTISVSPGNKKTISCK
jgi:hypothetical protein